MRYTTLFDSNYAPQGLALIASMRRHCRPFKLSVLALTDECYKLLFSLGLAAEDESCSITIHTLKDVMSDVSDTRPLAQMAVSMPWKHFCWAMNAVFCEYILGVYRDSVLSLDADTFFYSSPAEMVDSLVGCSVAAPPHRFPPHLEHTVKERGKYNVGGVYFAYGRMGMSMSEWWADRVCERCDEKTCGDQLYWNTIAEMAGDKFRELPIGFNMAPWMAQFRYGRMGDGQTWIHEPLTRAGLGSVPLIHYHFHEFSTTHHRRILYHSTETKRVFGLSNYHLRSDTLSLIYAPYTQEVERAMDSIEKVAT